MKILVVGGTRFFGIPMVNALLKKQHDVTIATRGNSKISFDGEVSQVIFDKTDPESVRAALGNQTFDLIIDKIAYSSNDVKSLLQNACCKKYIQMSSCAVYPESHLNTREEEFTAADYKLNWIDRTADYQESKRQAERAALEFLNPSDCAFVRYPVVLGQNDYTGRLRFYVEHVANQTPMHIDDLDMSIPFINEKEAGEFIAHLADNFTGGAVNGSSNGCVKISQIIQHAEKITDKKAVIEKSGDAAPFNGLTGDQSYNTEKAAALGWNFSDLDAWLYQLMEWYLK